MKLDGCRFEQQIVPRGAQVCVFGHYSTNQRGIVPDPDWVQTTHLLLGDPAEAGARLAPRARMQLVLATVFALAATGILGAWASP